MDYDYDDKVRLREEFIRGFMLEDKRKIKSLALESCWHDDADAKEFIHACSNKFSVSGLNGSGDVRRVVVKGVCVACAYGNLYAVNHLLSSGYKLRNSVQRGLTLAVRFGHVTVVERLLAYPSQDASYLANVTLQVAIRGGDEKIIRLILGDPRVQRTLTYEMFLPDRDIYYKDYLPLQAEAATVATQWLGRHVPRDAIVEILMFTYPMRLDEALCIVV